jgi:hypothetical protein
MADEDDAGTKPKEAGPGGDGNVVADNEDGQEEAAEILANLLQNQAVVPISTNRTNNSNAADGHADTDAAAVTTTTGGSGDTSQEIVIQQMLQQLKLGGAIALPSGGGDDAEKKHHAFWDTQVRGWCVRHSFYI